MTTRTRLTARGTVAALSLIEAAAAVDRPALHRRMTRLRDYLDSLPGDQHAFQLLAAAKAADPDGTDPLTAFREFRRTLNAFASEHAVDLVLVADGRKRAPAGTREWWAEGTDAADRRLSELAEASTAAVADTPIVPARGRNERDGKTVVRTFFDIAPTDASAVEGAIAKLQMRLDTDRSYIFQRLPSPRSGDVVETVRKRTRAGADLVIEFLTPAFLALPPASAKGRVVPIRWTVLGERSDLGRFGGVKLFPSDDAALGRLRGNKLDDALVDLHTELVRVLETPWVDPVADAALALAAADEPSPIAIRAIRTVLDKGVGGTSATAGPSVDVVGHLLSWATAPSNRPYFVIFGEYGMGKTVSAQTFTQRLLSLRDGPQTAPLPIYFDLRLLSQELRKRDATLDELLADLLKRAWLTGRSAPVAAPDDVIAAVQERGAVVVYDGLDEALVHMTELQGQSFLRELLRILPPQLASAPGAGRIVLTCRTHFFRTVRDQHTFFRTQDRDGVGRDLYEALHLLPFDESQVRKYLEVKQGVDGVDRALALIRSVHDLRGLAARPQNLRVIVELLGEIERRIAEGGAIDAAGLYEVLVQSWLERDMGKHQLERDHKVLLMEDLAAHLWRSEARRIAVGDLERWLRTRLDEDEDLRRWANLAKRDPAVLAEDLRTATFIVRPGAEEFEFAHTSLLEYFLARFLFRTMHDGCAEQWAMPTVSPETLDFLGEMATRDGTQFVSHIEHCSKAYVQQASELIVRYAFRAVERGAPAPSLRGFRLAGADLRGTSTTGPIELQDSDLSGADLRDTVLRRVRLDRAALAGAQLARSELQGCRLRDTNLTRVDLRGSLVRSAELHGATFPRELAADSQWLWCTGGPPAGLRVAPAHEQPHPDTALQVLAGSMGGIAALSWSPDGTRMAVADKGGIVVWNPHTRVQQARLPGVGAVLAVAWSASGTLLASGGADGAVRLWDIARPSEAPVELGRHLGRVGALAWSPDGARLASAGDDGVVRLWDTGRLNAQAVELGRHDGSVHALAWTGQGDWLASGGEDGVARFWSPKRPKTPPVEVSHNVGALHALAWSPDGTHLATGGHDGEIRIVDPNRPHAEPVGFASRAGSVIGLDWSIDGVLLASCHMGGPVRVWDTGRTAMPIDLGESTGGISAVAWSPDGGSLAGGGGDGVLRIWDLCRPSVPDAELGHHADLVHALAWSPDNRSLASASDGVVRLWDPRRRGAAPVELGRHGDSVQALVWSPDGTRLASGGNDGAVRVWQAARRTARPLDLGRRDYLVRALAWSPDGTRVASGGSDGTVRLWSPGASSAPPVPLGRHIGEVFALAWSPTNGKLASGGRDVLLWDTDQTNSRPAELSGQTEWVTTLAWSPDGRRLAGGGESGALWLWDLSRLSATPAVLGGGGGHVGTLAWSPFGDRLATGGNDGVVRLWDPGNPSEAPEEVGRHAGGVLALAWSPDGSLVASGGVDSAIAIWNPTTGTLVVTMHHFENGAWAVIDADGQPVNCHGEVWRWLRWRRTDPETGESVLLPAEYFGALPGVPVP